MKEKGLRFYYSNKTDIVFLRSDPAFLEQILVNLLSNAIKYTEKGFIELVIDETNKKQLKFSIRDTGIGIEESKREKVFKEMVQADGSIYSRSYEGIGLGIPVVSGFLESLGGYIDFTSTVGVGSTFWFTIPLLFEDNSVKHKKLKKILYVEDNKVNQMVAKKIIEKLGCVLDVADNGNEAVRNVKFDDYDLILMDYSMPVMNGAITTKWIREHVSKEIPIIGLTAFMEKELIDECINSGMNEVIHKPFRLSDMEKVFLRYQIKKR